MFLLPLVAWVIIVQVMHGGLLGWVLIVVAAAMAALMWVQIRRGAEKSAFFAQSLFLAVGVTTVFLAIYPKVLPSTVDDSFSLTVSNASSSGYTLTVMLIVAIVFVPIVLAYQIWSYSVFAKRLKTEHIPPAHQVPVAIRSHHQ